MRFLVNIHTTLVGWKFYGKRKLLCATSLASFLYVNSLCIPITASRNCINPQGKISIPYPRGHNAFYEAYHCKCITKTFFNKMKFCVQRDFSSPGVETVKKGLEESVTGYNDDFIYVQLCILEWGRIIFV